MNTFGISTLWRFAALILEILHFVYLRYGLASWLPQLDVVVLFN